MKLVGRDPQTFASFDVLAAVGKQRGLSLADPASRQEIVDLVAESMAMGADNDIMIYGKRTEAMFGFVAASLGKCMAVKEEDAGNLYVPADHDVAIPDFRLVLEEEEFLVEVKNHRDPGTPVDMSAAYLDRLRNYGKLFRRDVKLAVYWSALQVWTLIGVEKLPKDADGNLSLTLSAAAKINEMATLGDRLLGTKAPLTLRVLTDKNKPRRVDSEGRAEFTVGGVELLCDGVTIKQKFERDLAFYFMLYGGWDAPEGPEPEVEDGELISISLSVFPPAPPEFSAEQGFELLCWLSTMISRQFDHLTTSESGVERLSPVGDPEGLALKLPEGYRGQDLPLWIFVVRPNYDD